MKKVKFIFSHSELQAFVGIISHLPANDCNMFTNARNEVFFKIVLRLGQRLMCYKHKNTVSFNMTECFFYIKH